MPYHCGICDDSFDSKADLKQHTAHHPDIQNSKMHCPVCKWPFDDQLALEAHQRTSEHFPDPSNTGTQIIITCDRCSRDFTSQREYGKHRSWPNGSCADFKQKKTPPKSQTTAPTYVDQDTPAPAVENATLGYDDVTTVVSAELKKDKFNCNVCKRVYNSRAKYNNHFLGCRPPLESIVQSLTIPSTSAEVPPAAISRQAHRTLDVPVPAPVPESKADNVPVPMQTITVKTKSPVHVQAPVPSAASQLSVQSPNQGQSRTLSAANEPTNEAKFRCQKPGCGKVFRSAPALKVHDGDVHGVGGQRLDLHGRDSWMLSQQQRERLRAEGLLRAAPAAMRGRGGRQVQNGTRPVTVQQTVATTTPTALHRTHSQPMLRPPGPTMAFGSNDGGPADMEQAKLIQGKILRLLIQSDIYITNHGKLTACEIDWTRIGTSAQRDVVGRIEDMIHLPKALQGEYLPKPKAFANEYEYSYPPGEFQMSPTRNQMKPGLGAVALGCAKVILADGAQDIVKIAAVDVVTGRILMNHLVCTSPNAAVADWRSASTGLFAWRDMEHARSYGYKIFKGWTAARSALYRFIDTETIIVGHNLRSDLDALRMLHGRAIDVVKVYENAAKGPLTKTQLGLEGLAKRLMNIQLKDDPEYGRDVLMNAFAAREFVLWACKHKPELENAAKQTSLDLQRAGL
ncbi:hypothetical protein NX059_008507 [Plenodomus lindquistii]|nr:hypothetical protein NX059_008507 [Plenodomus lindquistii]